MKYLISICLLLTCAPTLIGQQFVIDSLTKRLKLEQDPIRIADIHLGLVRANNFVNHNSDQIQPSLEVAMKLSKKHNYLEGKTAAIMLEGLRKYNNGAPAEDLFKDLTEALALAKSIPSKTLEAQATFKLAEYFVYDKNDYKQGINLLSDMIARADETVSDVTLGNCYKVLALAYEIAGDYDLTINAFEKALIHFRRAKADPFVDNRLGTPTAMEADHGMMNYAHVHHYLGRIYRHRGQLQKSLDYLTIAINIFEKAEAHQFIGLSSEELGITYQVLGMNEASLEAFQLAAKKFEEVDSQADLAYIFYRLGQVFRAEKEYTSAKSFLSKSLDIALQRLDSVLLLDLYDGFGAVSYAQQNYDEALEYIRERQSVASALKDTSAFAINDISFSQIFLAQQNFDQSLRHAMQALEWSNQFNSLDQQFFSYSLLSAIYSNTGQFDSAAIFLAFTDSMVNQTNAADHRLELQKRKVDYHELKGDYQQALDAYKTYFDLHSDLYTADSQKKLRQEQVRQDVVSIEKEKDLAEREAALLAQRNRLYLLLAIVLLSVLLFGIYLFNQLRKNKRQIEAQNIQLQQLNATKDKFFGIIAHDIRSPIVALESVGEQMNYYLKKDNPEKLIQLTQGVDATAKRLSGLLDNLLNWALLQQGVIPYHPKPLNVKNIGDQILKMYQGNAEAKEINLQLEIEDDIKVYADESALNTILRNLISNAIKYTSRGGTVTLSTTTMEEKVFISINDSGTGISAAQLSKIFTLEKASKKGTAGEKGTGLGLTLVKELTELNKGTLQVNSAEGEGSRFEVGLPMVA